MAIRAIERSTGNVRAIIVDALTQEDAMRIRDLALRQPCGTQVTVDVRFARSCLAHALLTLSGARTPAGAALGFVGLSAANQRLLQYLDLDFRASGPTEERPGQQD